MTKMWGWKHNYRTSWQAAAHLKVLTYILGLRSLEAHSSPLVPQSCEWSNTVSADASAVWLYATKIMSCLQVMSVIISRTSFPNVTYSTKWTGSFISGFHSIILTICRRRLCEQAHTSHMGSNFRQRDPLHPRAQDRQQSCQLICENTLGTFLVDTGCY